MKFFENQVTLSPTLSQPRSFERWRLRDLLDESQHGFDDGKAQLEAEAEGCEPGESGRMDGEELEELEKGVMMANSMTEVESQAPPDYIADNTIDAVHTVLGYELTAWNCSSLGTKRVHFERFVWDVVRPEVAPSCGEWWRQLEEEKGGLPGMVTK